MRKKYEVSIIIVNWNGFTHLKKCLSSLLKLKRNVSFEIIVVDNGSTDKSLHFVKRLRKKHKNIALLENGRNLGFAEANNIGKNIASGNYILFLNNDTTVSTDFLSILVSEIKKKRKCAAVQPKILLMDHSSTIDSAGSFFTNTGILYHRGHKQRDQALFNIQDTIFSMKGACMLIKAKVLDEVGLFDKDYFAYFEETDLCTRILLAGYSIMYIPNSKIYHKGGGTTNKVGASFIQFHSFKNRIMSYLTNFEKRTLITLLPLHIFICLLSAMGFLFIGRPKYSFAILNALFWIVLHIKQIMKKRDYVQRHIRKVSDKDYLLPVTRSVPLRYYTYLFEGKLNKYRERV